MLSTSGPKSVSQNVWIGSGKENTLSSLVGKPEGCSKLLLFTYWKKRTKNVQGSLDLAPIGESGTKNRSTKKITENSVQGQSIK